MKKIVMVAAAVAAFGAGAMQVWQVPSWDARITEQGAVKEWIGKTWTSACMTPRRFGSSSDAS
ncbi:MAG: hypothetical protein IKF72_06420 [Kiritimatiellae bacterium]|nr:hypothetical protein [Kiritimatiellia bacterium]